MYLHNLSKPYDAIPQNVKIHYLKIFSLSQLQQGAYSPRRSPDIIMNTTTIVDNMCSYC